jgi:hypothetical protein
MPRAPDWLLGFGFSARDKGLSGYLDKIHGKLEAVKDDFNALTESAKATAEGKKDVAALTKETAKIQASTPEKAAEKVEPPKPPPLAENAKAAKQAAALAEATNASNKAHSESAKIYKALGRASERDVEAFWDVLADTGRAEKAIAGIVAVLEKLRNAPAGALEAIKKLQKEEKRGVDVTRNLQEYLLKYRESITKSILENGRFGRTIRNVTHEVDASMDSYAELLKMPVGEYFEDNLRVLKAVGQGIKNVLTAPFKGTDQTYDLLKMKKREHSEILKDLEIVGKEVMRKSGILSGKSAEEQEKIIKEFMQRATTSYGDVRKKIGAANAEINEEVSKMSFFGRLFDKGTKEAKKQAKYKQVVRKTAKDLVGELAKVKPPEVKTTEAVKEGLKETAKSAAAAEKALNGVEAAAAATAKTPVAVPVVDPKQQVKETTEAVANAAKKGSPTVQKAFEDAGVRFRKWILQALTAKGITLDDVIQPGSEREKEVLGFIERIKATAQAKIPVTNEDETRDLQEYWNQVRKVREEVGGLAEDVIEHVKKVTQGTTEEAMGKAEKAISDTQEAVAKGGNALAGQIKETVEEEMKAVDKPVDMMFAKVLSAKEMLVSFLKGTSKEAAGSTANWLKLEQVLGDVYQGVEDFAKKKIPIGAKVERGVQQMMKYVERLKKKTAAEETMPHAPERRRKQLKEPVKREAEATEAARLKAEGEKGEEGKPGEAIGSEVRKGASQTTTALGRIEKLLTGILAKSGKPAKLDISQPEEGDVGIDQPL